MTYPIRVYLGRFGEEQYLCDINDDYPWALCKGEFLLYEDALYKVLYIMHDIQNGEYLAFVRLAVEEDY